MLNEKRIQEAEQNVRLYLADGMLKKEVYEKNIYTILLRNAHESLEVAEFLLQHNKSDL